MKFNFPRKNNTGLGWAGLGWAGAGRHGEMRTGYLVHFKLKFEVRREPGWSEIYGL